MAINSMSAAAEIFMTGTVSVTPESVKGSRGWRDADAGKRKKETLAAGEWRDTIRHRPSLNHAPLPDYASSRAAAPYLGMQRPS
jgi:hypothetical protein